jgi:gas vesicle protein
MARSDSGDAATVVVAFVFGAIAGAAVALLMAPAPGEETRRILANRAREASDRANEVARQGREFVNQQRDNLSSAIDRGREAYNQARSGGAPGSPGDVGDIL